MFEENNIIEKHDFKKDGRFRYEQVPEEHHDHLIDVKNDKVIEFQNDDIEKLHKKLLKNLVTNWLTMVRIVCCSIERKNKLFQRNNNNFTKISNLISKVKFVAKNVVYIRNWSNSGVMKTSSKSQML